MIDAIDGRLRKGLVDARIEGLCRREVTTERLFHDDTSLCGAPRPREFGHDGAEQAGRDRQIEQRTYDRPECATQGVECGGVLIVTGHVLKALREPPKRLRIQVSMRGDAFSRTRAQLFDRPVPPRDADDRDVQMAAASHRVQRGKDLLVGEIARRSEQDQGVRVRLSHVGYRPRRWSAGARCPSDARYGHQTDTASPTGGDLESSLLRAS